MRVRVMENACVRSNARVVCLFVQTVAFYIEHKMHHSVLIVVLIVG